MKKIIIILVATVTTFITIYSFVVLNKLNTSYNNVLKLTTKMEEAIKKEGYDEKKYSTIEKYNGAVKEYNILVRKFPNKIYASLKEYKTIEYFVANKNTVVPKVDF